MRRMDYNRFANPTNFGEWDKSTTRFVLDKELEEGVYLIDTRGAAEGSSVGGILFATKFLYCHALVLSVYAGEPRTLEFLVGSKHVETPADLFEEEGLIYLYKIN